MSTYSRAIAYLEARHARAVHSGAVTTKRPGASKDVRQGGAEGSEPEMGTPESPDATEARWWAAAIPGPYPMDEEPDTRYGDCQSAAHRSLLVKQRGQITRLQATIVQTATQRDEARATIEAQADYLLAKDDTIERLGSKVKRVEDLIDGYEQNSGRAYWCVVTDLRGALNYRRAE